MIFQEYALVERLTVMENVLSGRLGYVGFWQSFMRKFPQSDIDEAFRLLARVGLDHMANKRADELSGGQRQRVGICRALIQNPELLLVDEPTASLDPKTSRQIMRLIKELCAERKLSAIINIHDVMLAQMFAERIVGLRLGEIVYDGPPDGLTAEVLTQIYGEEDWSATIRKVDDERADEMQTTPRTTAPSSRRSTRPRPPGGADVMRSAVDIAHRARRWKKPPLIKRALAALDARPRRRDLSRARLRHHRRQLDTGSGTACRAARNSSPRFSRPTSPAAGTRSSKAFPKACG